MNSRVADAKESEAGIALALRFLDDLAALEPQLLEQERPDLVPFALMNSFAQHLAVACARRWPQDSKAQRGAVAGYACGLAGVFFQRSGDAAPSFLAQTLGEGLLEGTQRARLLFRPGMGPKQ